MQMASATLAPDAQQRTAAALAIIHARRNAARVVELQAELQQFEQKCRVALEVLCQTPGLATNTQKQQQLAVLLAALHTGSEQQGHVTAAGISDAGLAHAVAAQQLMLCTSGSNSSPAAKDLQAILGDRRAGVEKIIRHATVMRMAAAVSQPAGDDSCTSTSTQIAPSLQSVLQQNTVQLVAAFLFDTLVHVPPSDLQRSYIVHALETLAAAVSSTSRSNMMHSKLTFEAAVPLPAYSAALELFSKLLRLAADSCNKPAASNAAEILQAAQQHPRLGLLLLQCAAQALQLQIQQQLQHHKQLVQLVCLTYAPAPAHTASPQAGGGDMASVLHSMEQCHAYMAHTFSVIKGCIQQLPAWLAAEGQLHSNMPVQGSVKAPQSNAAPLHASQAPPTASDTLDDQPQVAWLPPVQEAAAALAATWAAIQAAPPAAASCLGTVAAALRAGLAQLATTLQAEALSHSHRAGDMPALQLDAAAAMKAHQDACVRICMELRQSLQPA